MRLQAAHTDTCMRTALHHRGSGRSVVSQGCTSMTAVGGTQRHTHTVHPPHDSVRSECPPRCTATLVHEGTVDSKGTHMCRYYPSNAYNGGSNAQRVGAGMRKSTHIGR